MDNLKELIETTERLCNTLSYMADNEVKFGWRICSMMEQISYEMQKNAEDLKAINNFVGDSA